MADKIEITREQFNRWFNDLNDPTRGLPNSFDSLKAFVEKPKRREVLPGDLPPMTKEEAREWVENLIEALGWGDGSQAQAESEEG